VPDLAPGLTIRPCVEADAPAIADLVRQLALYERLEAFAVATPDDFRRHLFGPNPAAEAVIAELDGRPVGFALFFTTFSTFRGQPGMFLEDVFVRPEHRGQGIGKALLATVARRSLERQCARLEWAVLDWNTPAIGFYKAAGACPLDDWTTFRIDDEALVRLASSGEFFTRGIPGRPGAAR
jgi:GNAT superfamily N-acetyltransferase